MLLGTLIKQVMAARGPFVADLEERNAELAQSVAEQARMHSMSSHEFVADTVHRFMASEDSESWTTIIGNLQRSDDPGYAFIETIMRTRLSHSCGS